MVTVIRIDPKWRRIARFLAVALPLLPAAHGVEQDIYVTTGPDGVEIFSNLPRAPIAAPDSPGKAVRGEAAIDSTQLARNAWSAADTAGLAGIQSSEAGEPGKSFLLDD